MENRKRICALCLEICETFKCVEKNTKNILDLFLPEKDFTIIQGPVMCENCSETLTKCFDFKTKCLYTHDYLISFINNKNGVKLDLNDVFQNKNVTATDVPEDQDICVLCTDLVQNCYTVPLYVKDRECKLERMVEQCLPELDLSFVKKPVICADCRSSLESCFRLVTNCLLVEQRIKRYRENVDINSKGQIELSDLLLSTIKTEKTNDVASSSFDMINVEKQVCLEGKNPKESELVSGVYVSKLEKTFYINENSNDDNENVNESLLALDIPKDNNPQLWSPKNVSVWEEESNKLAAIKIEETLCAENGTECKDDIFVKREDKKCLSNEEIEIKTENDVTRFDDGIVMIHLLARKASSKVITYRCGYCTYQTKHQQEITAHVQNHTASTMYHCGFCAYQTNQEGNFERHLLKHKDPSEVTMYKCDSCLFQTKYKRHIKTHLLNHLPPMYKCDSCIYQTPHQNHFNRHLAKHQKPKVTTYKCRSCSYQTTYLYDFKKHNHFEVTEDYLYKCDSCIYETTYKCRFNAHLLTHKDSAKIHKCDVCTYQTTKKYILIKHMLKQHKDPLEEPLYKCDICMYQTQYKKLFARHSQKHKYSSTIYKCDICTYQTYRENTFNTHLLRHKKPPEVTKNVIFVYIGQGEKAT